MSSVRSRLSAKSRSVLRSLGAGLSSSVREIDVRGVCVRMHVTTDVEDYRVSTYATKEPETLDWIDSTIKPGDVLYDLGANIGIYSLYAAIKGAVVFAFEPEALNFAQLNRNIVANPGVNITPYCIAIGAERKLTRFYSREFAAGAACHGLDRPVDPAGRDFRPAHQQGTMVVTLDELWRDFGLPAPRHIKIDVDGAETDVLAGGSATLRHGEFASVLVEVTGPAEAIQDRVGHLRLASRGDPMRTSPTYPSLNHIFVRAGN